MRMQALDRVNWPVVYQRIMSDFHGGILVPHVLILGGFMILGIILGVYMQSSLLLMLFIWFLGAGVSVSYMLYKEEFSVVFSKKPPYAAMGVIQKRVKKIVQEKGGEEFEEFYFDVLIDDAFTISKSGLARDGYYERRGEQRLEVPESMFLSLREGEPLEVVCEPDDFVWGVIRGDEVIRIDM